jgi:hypothetical protein
LGESRVEPLRAKGEQTIHMSPILLFGVLVVIFGYSFFFFFAQIRVAISYAATAGLILLWAFPGT